MKKATIKMVGIGRTIKYSGPFNPPYDKFKIKFRVDNRKVRKPSIIISKMNRRGGTFPMNAGQTLWEPIQPDQSILGQPCG